MKPFSPAFTDPSIRIVSSREQGRFLISTADFKPGDILGIIPVLVLPETQIDTLNTCDLYSYVFEWDEQERYKKSGDLVQCDRRFKQAVALGLISLCNHADEPNSDYQFMYKQQSLRWVCKRPIISGDEITIHYKVPLWFTPYADEDTPAAQTAETVAG